MMSGRHRPLAAPPPPLAPAPATPPASQTTTITTTPQQEPPPPLKSQVIPIVPTEMARIYNLTHPFVVLSLYYFSFPSIVANSVLALKYLLIPLSVLQLAYVVICLHATTTSTTTTSSRSGSSSYSSSSSSSSKHKGKGKSKNAQGNNGLDLSGKVTVAILSLLLTTLLATPVVTILLILFGGPFTTHFQHNILCASHMSVLAFLPLFYVYGVNNSEIWDEIISAILPFDDVWGGTVGTVLGAWFGAVPIPLDWDREWQKWPITIVTGAYLGWGIGRFAGGYLFRGKRIKFD